MKNALVFMLMLSATGAICQQGSTVPLKEVLDIFQKQGIHFSYDAELVSLTEVVFDSQHQDLGQFLAFLDSTTAFSANQISESYFSLTVKITRYSLTVLDSMDQQSVGAENIIVLLNDHPIPTEAKSKSEVTFTYKPSFGDQLSVYGLGFTVRKLPFASLMNQRVLSVSIAPEIVQLEDVVVHDYMTKGIDLDPSDQHISISIADLPLLPGETDGDLFASLVALPGVTTPDNRPGNLYIRGSSTDQSLITYDDIPIYHRGHYYGTISPYNPKMVDHVNVYRNGFHPRHGGRVGGAVEINSTEHLTEEITGGVGSNLLYGSGYIKAPIIKNKFGIAIAGRQSYPVSFQSPKLEAISQMVYAGSAVLDTAGNLPKYFHVNFYDYTAKTEFIINKYNKVSATGIYAKTHTKFQSYISPSKEHNGFTNSGLNVKWESKLAQKWSSHLSIINSKYHFESKIQKPADTPKGAPDVYSVNDLLDFGVFEELSGNLGGISLQTGLSYKYQDVSYDYQNLDVRHIELTTRAESVQASTFSTFLNAQFSPTSRLFTQFGSRATYYSELDNVRFEPRFSANYDLTKSLILKASAGQYYQYVSQVKNLEFTNGGFDNEVWVLANARSAKIIRGRQSMLGAIWSKRTWVVDVEGYYKTADNVTYSNSRRFSNTSEWTTADHEMYGVDIYLKKQFGSHISMWGGYTYSQIKIVLDTAKNVTYNSKYSQPNAVYLGGSYIKNRIKLSLGWKYSSGLYVKSIDVVGASMQINPRTPPSQNPFLQLPDRYKPVHMFDASASYVLQKSEQRPFKTTIGLSIINLYNQVNQTDNVIRATVGTAPPVLVPRNAIKFAPNLMVMLEF